MFSWFLLSGKFQPPTIRQWQPTLTAHDPNPPITLEDAAAGVETPTQFGFATPHRINPPLKAIGAGLAIVSAFAWCPQPIAPPVVTLNFGWYNPPKQQPPQAVRRVSSGFAIGFAPKVQTLGWASPAALAAAAKPIRALPPPAWAPQAFADAVVTPSFGWHVSRYQPSQSKAPLPAPGVALGLAPIPQTLGWHVAYRQQPAKPVFAYRSGFAWAPQEIAAPAVDQPFGWFTSYDGRRGIAAVSRQALSGPTWVPGQGLATPASPGEFGWYVSCKQKPAKSAIAYQIGFAWAPQEIEETPPVVIEPVPQPGAFYPRRKRPKPAPREQQEIFEIEEQEVFDRDEVDSEADKADIIRAVASELAKNARTASALTRETREAIAASSAAEAIRRRQEQSRMSALAFKELLAEIIAAQVMAFLAEDEEEAAMLLAMMI